MIHEAAPVEWLSPKCLFICLFELTDDFVKLLPLFFVEFTQASFVCAKRAKGATEV
jgi:hypothetical protein